MKQAETRTLRDVLLEDVTSHPMDWFRMNVLADYLDENGEPELSHAFRWAASRKKWPEAYRLGPWWIWHQKNWGRNFDIPPELFNWDGEAKTFATVEYAFLWLADRLERLREVYSL